MRVVGIWLQEMFQKLNGWFLNATLLGFDFCATSVVFLLFFFSSKTFNFLKTFNSPVGMIEMISFCFVCLFASVYFQTAPRKGAFKIRYVVNSIRGRSWLS